MWEAADSSALTSDRTYNPQTDTETRRDTPVTTLRWAKSPGLTNSSRTIDSSYDNGSPLRSSPLPSQAAEQAVAKVWEWKMGPRRGRLDLRARVKTEAELPTRCTRPSCRISLALAACLSLRSSSSQHLFARLLTAGMGWNDTAPRKKKKSISLPFSFQAGAAGWRNPKCHPQLVSGIFYKLCRRAVMSVCV